MITISRLIEILNLVEREHGDLQVFLYNDEYCDDDALAENQITVMEAGTENWTKYNKRLSLGGRPRYDSPL